MNRALISKLQSKVSLLCLVYWPLALALIVGILIKFGLPAAILGGFIAFTLASGLSDRANEKLRESAKSEITALSQQVDQVQRELRGIYEIYVAVPPDWDWRREQVFARDKWKCQECGRDGRRSQVPFHVHHLVQRSHPDGDHSLENLQFLCEICHSKLPQHGLVLGARRKRLSDKKKRRS